MPSRFVSAKNRPKRSLADPPMFNCEHCGKLTPRSWRSNGRGSGHFVYGQKYCSTGCANKKRATGKTWLDKHGYPQVNVEGRGGVAMHRVVMEKKLGRKLFTWETVHHKDGDRANYAEDNLELWSSRHGRGQRVADLPFTPMGGAELGPLSFPG
jgi:hypothetical protein